MRRLASLFRRRPRRRCDEVLGWGFEPPEEELALVAVGPPKRPRPSSAVALEQPTQWRFEHLMPRFPFFTRAFTR